MLRESNADKELNPDGSQVCELSEPDFYLFFHSTSHKDGWRTGEGDCRPLFSVLTFLWRDSHGSSICPAIISVTHFLILQRLLLSFWTLDTVVYSVNQGNRGCPHGPGPGETPMLESHPLDMSLQLCMTETSFIQSPTLRVCHSVLRLLSVVEMSFVQLKMRFSHTKVIINRW